MLLIRVPGLNEACPASSGLIAAVVRLACRLISYPTHLSRLSIQEVFMLDLCSKRIGMATACGTGAGINGDQPAPGMEFLYLLRRR